MRGALADPAKLKMGQTRSTNPAAAEAQRTAVALASAATTGDPDAPRPLRDGKGRHPLVAKRSGSPFLAALRHCKAITPAEERIITAAGVEGMTLQQATEFWTYQLVKLEKARSDGKINAKSYHVGLNQLLTAAVKLAELSVRTGDTAGLSGPVQFVLNLQQTQIAPGFTQELPGDNGDVIEVG